MSDLFEKLENTTHNEEANSSDRFDKLEQAIRSLESTNREQLQQMEKSIQRKVEQSVMSLQNESRKKLTPLLKAVQARKTIKFSFSLIELDDNNYILASPVEEVAGENWDIYVIFDYTREDDLSIYLRYHGGGEADFRDTSFTISFYAADKVYSKKYSHRFQKVYMRFDQCGYDGVMTCEQFSEFADDATFTAEVDLIIYGDTSDAVQAPEVVDKFCSSESFPWDRVLLIDGQRIHVSKGLLSVHSQTFNTLFSGDFVEKDRSEILMEDLDAAEFCQLLQAIYPSLQETISSRNVKCIIKLADRFAMDAVLNRCEQFLMGSPTAWFSYAEKMLIAQEYGLQKLMETCIAQNRSVESLKKLMQEPEYAAFSDKTTRILLESSLGRPDNQL